jgi:hypothetical protein
MYNNNSPTAGDAINPGQTSLYDISSPISKTIPIVKKIPPGTSKPIPLGLLDIYPMKNRSEKPMIIMGHVRLNNNDVRKPILPNTTSMPNIMRAAPHTYFMLLFI